jgi:hypothetical protein
MDWQGRPTNWPPLAVRTPLDFVFLGYVNDAVYVPPLATFCQKLVGELQMQWLQLPLTWLTKCGLKLNTDGICLAALNIRMTYVTKT